MFAGCRGLVFSKQPAYSILLGGGYSRMVYAPSVGKQCLGPHAANDLNGFAKLDTREGVGACFYLGLAQWRLVPALNDWRPGNIPSPAP